MALSNNESAFGRAGYYRMSSKRINEMFSIFLQKGDMRSAKQLLNSCTDTLKVDNLDDDGSSLLHVFCNKGDFEAVKFLVHEGVNLSLKDSQGRTPLHLCSAKSQAKVTRYLVEHGANVMVYNKEGELPLDVAGSLETALVLVEKMIALGYNDLVNDYLIPLNLSKRKIDETEEIEPLTSSSLLRSLQNKQKLFATEDLSATGILETQTGCRSRLENDKAGRRQKAEEQKDNDDLADIPQQTRRYTFPSFLGFMKPTGSILKRSMSFTSSPNSLPESPEDKMEQPITSDRKSGSRSVTFPSDILCQVCIMDNDYQDLKRLILCDKVTDLNKLYANGISALHLSAIENRHKCAEVLVDCGADIEITDPHGWTPLHAAVFAGNIKCVKTLCNKGANICATTNNGETVFDLAVTDLIKKYLKMMAIRLVMSEKRHFSRQDSV